MTAYLLRARGLRARAPFLAGVLLAMMVFVVPAKATEKSGPDVEAAVRFVTELVDQAMAVLRNDELTTQERDAQLSTLLRAGFALDYISRFVLGRHWRKATPEQRQDYRSLFTDFIINTYSARLDEYHEETVKIGTGQAVGKRDVLVESNIVQRDAPPIPVEWRVRYRKNEFKVIDLKVEGISMAISQREEFSAVIQKKGIDGLIDSLRQKVMNPPTKQAAAQDTTGGS